MRFEHSIVAEYPFSNSIDMNPSKRHLDDISEIIIGYAIQIHRRVGPGLLESVYEVLLAHYLTRHGLKVLRQLPVPLTIDGIDFEVGFRLDLLVEDIIVVETKSVKVLSDADAKQALTHITLMKVPLALLINFGQATLKDGLKRIVNNLNPGDSPSLRVNQPPESE